MASQEARNSIEQNCPDCGTAWPDKLILSAKRCAACTAEREQRVSAWLGDTPPQASIARAAPGKQASPGPALETAIMPEADTTPRRSLCDLFDALADLGIKLTLNPDDTLIARPTPLTALITELRAKRSLVLLAMQTFAQTNADANTLGIDDPNERETIRMDNLAWALEDIGEKAEALAARRRAASARGLAEYKKQGFFG